MWIPRVWVPLALNNIRGTCYLCDTDCLLWRCLSMVLDSLWGIYYVWEWLICDTYFPLWHIVWVAPVFFSALCRHAFLLSSIDLALVLISFHKFCDVLLEHMLTHMHYCKVYRRKLHHKCCHVHTHTHTFLSVFCHICCPTWQHFMLWAVAGIWHHLEPVTRVY